MDFLVGTFNTPEIYTLHFAPASSSSSSDASLTIKKVSKAVGNHSWLSLNAAKDRLYATVWGDPPSIAAYRVHPSHEVELINEKPIQGRSGYVACSATHVYSAGGATGEAFELTADGAIGNLVQRLAFVDKDAKDEHGRPAVLHGDFGGLRHGAHSIDLAPDGKSLFVADIGRNCIWTYAINAAASAGEPHLSFGTKHISPRSNDGPRHTTPHPNGKILYSLQEHSSMVDAFSIAGDGVTLKHVQGEKIIPADKNPKDYWADEVRVGTSAPGQAPKYLYASTRGLEATTMGYVAVFKLNSDGTINGEALHIFETPTCGGIANAVEPAPGTGQADVEYMALTDSQEGWVFVLSFDGNKITETARVKLENESGKIVLSATAVWL